MEKINFLESVKKEIENNVNEEMQRKIYWWLPLDQYNQPSGKIVKLEMNFYELQVMKNRGEYIFTSYMSACERAFN